MTNKGVAFLVKALGKFRFARVRTTPLFSILLQLIWLFLLLGAPDVVPATYKKKRGGAGMDAPKMADDGEGKPAPDGETPGGMGRGARWDWIKSVISWIKCARRDFQGKCERHLQEIGL